MVGKLPEPLMHKLPLFLLIRYIRNDDDVVFIIDEFG